MSTDERTTTIEAKNFSPDAADQILTKALRGKRGQITRADAVTASGLPAHVTEDSLERLLKKYRSHLAVTEEGELLYAFDPSFRRRDEPTLAERLRAFGRAAARVGMAVFKVWIAVTLIAYVVGFLLLILGVMASGHRDDRRDDRRGGFGGGGLGWLWWFFLPDFRWGGYGRGYGYRTDRWGRPIPTSSPRGRLDRDGKPRKRFLASVYDFVFGPAKATEDSLLDEREVLAYLRSNKARVTATDLVSLFGWSYRRAEEEVTRLMVDYEGEPLVTDEGVIVYEFPKLLKSADAREERGTWRHAWQRIEERPALTGNTRTMDWVIGLFAAFNLVVSLFAADWARLYYGLTGTAWHVALTAFPLAFFTLFLAVPALRALARRAGDRGRALRNRQRLLLKQVLDARGGPLPEAEGMKELALALDGEVDADASGRVTYKFPRVSEELGALKKHLAGVDVPAERRLGAVVFGTDEGEDELPGGPKPPRQLN